MSVLYASVLRGAGLYTLKIKTGGTKKSRALLFPFQYNISQVVRVTQM